MLLFLSYVIANCCKKIPIPGMFLGMQYLERTNGLVLIMRKDSCLNITNNYSVIFCGNCQNGLFSIAEYSFRFYNMDKTKCFSSCLLFVVGYRHLPCPAGRGCALVDGAPWQTAAVPRDPGVSC